VIRGAREAARTRRSDVRAFELVRVAAPPWAPGGSGLEARDTLRRGDTFKTLKYPPDYPGHFGGELHARGWLEPFFGWHNDEHHHSNLALFTPADVFFGRVEQVRILRQAALDAAYAAHPERFPHGAPRVLLPPSEVSINPVTSSAVTIDSAPGVHHDGSQPEAEPTLDVATTAAGLGRGPERAANNSATVRQPRGPRVTEAALPS
jgi:hypothetical protein